MSVWQWQEVQKMLWQTIMRQHITPGTPMKKAYIALAVLYFIFSSIAFCTEYRSTLKELRTTFTNSNGRILHKIIVPGGRPPEYRMPAVVPSDTLIEGDTILAKSLSVPAFNWTYGCSATAAGMIFGYYDRNGYPDIYTGTVDGGVCPMNNSVWGSTTYSKTTCGECPFVASHQGIEGRSGRGHVDDYWIDYGNSGPDPYVNNWSEHTPKDCTADFMGTSMSKYKNSDGATTFYLNPGGDPLYDPQEDNDGCHGMRLFVESRGYSVTENYTQYIKGHGGNTKGYTFANYKSDIDAGCPVMIHVSGHSMTGVGYDDAGGIEKIYIHDTWDYDTHEMLWGGSYDNMEHYGVTVLRISGDPPVPKPSDSWTIEKLKAKIGWKESPARSNMKVTGYIPTTLTTLEGYNSTTVNDLTVIQAGSTPVQNTSWEFEVKKNGRVAKAKYKNKETGYRSKAILKLKKGNLYITHKLKKCWNLEQAFDLDNTDVQDWQQKTALVILNTHETCSSNSYTFTYKTKQDKKTKIK